MDRSERNFLIGFIIIIIVLMFGGVLIFSRNSGDVNPSAKIPASDLISADSPSTGPENAKVTIVEFSDFECPACGLAHPAVREILAKNKDKVRFVYRNFPLPQHQYAQKAAEAALAAGAQGKYWEMHDLLFTNQTKLKFEDLNKYALQLKLKDLSKFTGELQSGKYADAVQKDVAAGNKIGINATPTFFINGLKMTDAPTLANFQKEIDKIK